MVAMLCEFESLRKFTGCEACLDTHPHIVPGDRMHEWCCDFSQEHWQARSERLVDDDRLKIADPSAKGFELGIGEVVQE
jgi:hypothetical protein